MEALERLVRLSSEELGPSTGFYQTVEPDIERQLKVLAPLYSMRNGFYAYAGALHVYPIRSETHLDIIRWNDRALWKHEYGDMAEGILCFAEDAFGEQFCVVDTSICWFNAETGNVAEFAQNIDGWAQRILDDPDFTIGYSLALDWQNQHGPIPEGHRLSPKVPFFLGGTYSVENLFHVDAAKGMGARGSIATQIRDYPDGTVIEIDIVD